MCVVEGNIQLYDGKLKATFIREFIAVMKRIVFTHRLSISLVWMNKQKNGHCNLLYQEPVDLMFQMLEHRLHKKVENEDAFVILFDFNYIREEKLEKCVLRCKECEKEYKITRH